MANVILMSHKTITNTSGTWVSPGAGSVYIPINCERITMTSKRAPSFFVVPVLGGTLAIDYNMKEMTLVIKGGILSDTVNNWVIDISGDDTDSGARGGSIVHDGTTYYSSVCDGDSLDHHAQRHWLTYAAGIDTWQPDGGLGQRAGRISKVLWGPPDHPFKALFTVNCTKLDLFEVGGEPTKYEFDMEFRIVAGNQTAWGPWLYKKGPGGDYALLAARANTIEGWN